VAVITAQEEVAQKGLDLILDRADTNNEVLEKNARRINKAAWDTVFNTKTAAEYTFTNIIQTGFDWLLNVDTTPRDRR